MTPILLASGNGGKEYQNLIDEVFYKSFKNETLLKSEDAAVIDAGRLAFTTDSFTVTPLFFKGGDIGKLSICGTCNDLAMMGAKPTYLSCAVIIEEGFSYEDLQRIVDSMSKELKLNGAQIVAGDTKVVPKGSVDKIFITTTGVGEITYPNISASNLETDNVILVSSAVGRHGAAIFSAREGINLESELSSDAKSLWPTVEKLISSKITIKAMRDATRGGLAAVLNEWAQASKVEIVVEEKAVPVSQEVLGVCELLGFDALGLANEGTFVLCVKKDDASKALEILKSFDDQATEIGLVTDSDKNRVVLQSAWGTSRILELPSGELLPRIC